MKLPRRQFLHLAAGVAALPALPRFARAQAYPSRPVHVIVGFTAGNNIDIVARLIGQWLSERLGQPFIIENRPGASGNIAATWARLSGASGASTFSSAPTIPARNAASGQRQRCITSRTSASIRSYQAISSPCASHAITKFIGASRRTTTRYSSRSTSPTSRRRRMRKRSPDDGYARQSVGGPPLGSHP